MKTFILVLILLFAISSYSQNTPTRERTLGKNVQLPDSIQLLAVKEFILQYYGTTFKYYNELKNGSYQFIPDIQRNIIYLNIIPKSGASARVILKRIANKNGNIEIFVEKNEIEKFVTRHHSGNSSNSPYPVTIINDRNILYDQMILYNGNIQQQDWKILNRSFIHNNLKNQDHDDAILFRNVVAGSVVTSSPTRAHFLTVDRDFQDIVYFDNGLSGGQSSYFDKTYGDGGFDKGQFYNPNGITIGRMVSVRGTTYYPIYVADLQNCRISRINFIIDDSQVNGSYFDNSSYTRLVGCELPYDVSYYKNPIDSSQDKIWVSESNPHFPYLSCYTAGGKEVKRYSGYLDTNSNTVYLFQAGMKSRMKTYDGYFSALSFVDNTRNYLVSCQLNTDGSARTVASGHDTLLVCHDILQFPSNDPINSVTFQRTSVLNNPWPYVWVTSTSSIHLIKMNSVAHTQYIASTYIPQNTDYNFSNLLNLIGTNDYLNLFTIEQWTDAYGIREYYPYCDIRQGTDTLLHYCNDSIDVMRYKAVFTNECWLQMKGYRMNKKHTWELVKIKTLNGVRVNDTSVVKWQLAGWNQTSNDLYVDLRLDLPLEDYALQDSVLFKVDVYPEYTYPSGDIRPTLEKTYITTVRKACLPRAGGCPYLFYKNNVDSNYIADNNVLHRSEYSGSGDITDYYKLQASPVITSSALTLYLAENENDSSFINQVKLYVIDYPSNRRLAMTESNAFVLYDSSTVKACDTVLLNTTNITSNVNYNNPGTPVNGLKTDSIYAHFNYGSGSMKSNGDNIDTKIVKQTKDGLGAPVLTYGLITNVGNLMYPISSVKDTGGVVTAHSIYSNTAINVFARRENNSIVILPLFGDTNKISNLKIKWQSDFNMKYLGMATLQYSGYNSSLVSLTKGYNVTPLIDTEITSKLTSADSAYGLVNSSAVLRLNFDLSGVSGIPSRYQRSYVLVVNGHYKAVVTDNPLAGKIESQVALTYRLSQNYPNPFNPSTKISYEIPKDSKVKLIIYDILGREVKRLVDNDIKKAGHYVVDFDGTNLASGVYFYDIEAGTFIESKKMVLVK